VGVPRQKKERRGSWRFKLNISLVCLCFTRTISYLLLLFTIPSPPPPPLPPLSLFQLHRLVVYNTMQLSPDLSTCPRPPSGCPPYSVLLTTADDTCVAATSAGTLDLNHRPRSYTRRHATSARYIS
jgi:hypothetical protein